MKIFYWFVLKLSNNHTYSWLADKTLLQEVRLYTHRSVHSYYYKHQRDCTCHRTKRTDPHTGTAPPHLRLNSKLWKQIIKKYSRILHYHVLCNRVSEKWYLPVVKLTSTNTIDDALLSVARFFREDRKLLNSSNKFGEALATGICSSTTTSV